MFESCKATRNLTNKKWHLVKTKGFEICQIPDCFGNWTREVRVGEGKVYDTVCGLVTIKYVATITICGPHWQELTPV
ncbi:hypothetical protein HanIR_Chr01g0028981 [Helianthus annuus]|nr:hypothetical protein HanIR_Chr01g0028981 [Helianthus annuus]